MSCKEFEKEKCKNCEKCIDQKCTCFTRPECCEDSENYIEPRTTTDD